jgi:hypothetical protein
MQHPSIQIQLLGRHSNDGPGQSHGPGFFVHFPVGLVTNSLPLRAAVQQSRHRVPVTHTEHALGENVIKFVMSVYLVLDYSGLQNDRDCSVGRSVGDRPSAATPHPVMVDLTGGETRPRGYTST